MELTTEELGPADTTTLDIATRLLDAQVDTLCRLLTEFLLVTEPMEIAILAEVLDALPVEDVDMDPTDSDLADTDHTDSDHVVWDLADMDPLSVLVDLGLMDLDLAVSAHPLGDLAHAALVHMDLDPLPGDSDHVASVHLSGHVASAHPSDLTDLAHPSDPAASVPMAFQASALTALGGEIS